MDPDYFKEYQTFVLYASDITGWIFSEDREGLYVCSTMDMSPIELPIHFMRVHNVMSLSTVSTI